MNLVNGSKSKKHMDHSIWVKAKCTSSVCSASWPHSAKESVTCWECCHLMTVIDIASCYRRSPISRLSTEAEKANLLHCKYKENTAYNCITVTVSQINNNGTVMQSVEKFSGHMSDYRVCMLSSRRSGFPRCSGFLLRS